MSEKIRPQVKQSSEFKAQGEADLPSMASAPDPGGARPESMIGALDATQAAAARATHNEPNRLGKPFAPNEAETLLANYQAKRTAWKDAYSRTRIEHGDEEEAYFEAKRLCIQAGLLPADS